MYVVLFMQNNFIFYFLSIREQICNVLAEFFFCEKNIKASKNLFLCLPIVYQCLAVSRKWDNFQRKNIQRYFYAVSWLQEM